MTEETTTFARIGAGSFATVYVWQGRSITAIKCFADPTRCAELLAEYQVHKAVNAAVGDSLFQVPEPGLHYPTYSKFKSWTCVQREAPQEIVLGAFTPWTGDPKRSKQLRCSRFFNANNFPPDAERCEQLQLPVAVKAQGIARILARIHYVTGMDGRDIEFVLGGHAKHPLSEHAFFCFDFNQMRPHEDSIRNLVDSFFVNDPYYPRPGMKYWDDFKDSYIHEARQAAAGDKAIQFINEIEATVADKAAPPPAEGRCNGMAQLQDF